MALLPRFHAPHLDASAPSVSLEPEEAHHLVHVVRVPVGAAVEVFDGHGTTRQGVVAHISKKSVVVEHLAVVESAREPRVPITLAMGWLRTDHMDAVVRDAAMLGVRRLQPLFTQRTTARVAARDPGHVTSRWQRIAVGALKQCGGAWLPDLRPPAQYADWIAAEPATAVRLILTEPDASSGRAHADVDGLAAEAVTGAVVLVGPEGGWTDGEVTAALRRGWRPWSLGPRVLRADAIPVAAISALRYAWERGMVR